jgi:hypothetical protein
MVHQCDSLVFVDFPAIVEDFKQQKCALLCSGSLDGFQAKEIHRRCERDPNTMTIVLNTNGTMFGEFALVVIPNIIQLW